MKLFGYLPDTLFQPLAGPKKHVYARLLLRLYERVFAARVLETPTKDEVLKNIASALPESGVINADELQEEGVEKDTNPYAHYVAYHRLRDTGWLIEEQEKWDVKVDMHPDAFMVIGAIADFANARVRVAGAVVEVKSNLEAAAKDPDTMAQGLANACETAVRFARSMRRILVGMGDIEDKILGKPDAASILRTFFRDFVDGLLIADYKQLKTSNNPYRYRRHISALASDLLHDTDRRAKLARAYIDQGVVPSGSALTVAEEQVVGELEKIRQVFEDVGPFMERIEEFRDRLERRVRTTVHYMDVMGEGFAERFARVIEALSATGRDGIELRLRAPDVGFPISEKALYIPPPPRSSPEKTRFERPRRDPYLKAYVAATTAFDNMVRVTPARMAAFIAARIGDQTRLHSSEIEIQTIEDLLAFRSLPAAVASAASAEIGPYRIVIENGRTDNEWINLPSFHIERASGEAV
ncbi:MAG TPA: Wadjet anti-phage system protein JetA family protein [Pseudolabrys sp.]|nr:Wadjet anti-phage system protein JetA family protein [Pseudolabrys sp.]